MKHGNKNLQPSEWDIIRLNSISKSWAEETVYIFSLHIVSCPCEVVVKISCLILKKRFVEEMEICVKTYWFVVYSNRQCRIIFMFRDSAFMLFLNQNSELKPRIVTVHLYKVIWTFYLKYYYSLGNCFHNIVYILSLARRQCKYWEIRILRFICNVFTINSNWWTTEAMQISLEFRR